MIIVWKYPHIKRWFVFEGWGFEIALSHWGNEGFIRHPLGLRRLVWPNGFGCPPIKKIYIHTWTKSLLVDKSFRFFALSLRSYSWVCCTRTIQALQRSSAVHLNVWYNHKGLDCHIGGCTRQWAMAQTISFHGWFQTPLNGSFGAPLVVEMGFWLHPI